jgi:hypothetical protein
MNVALELSEAKESGFNYLYLLRQNLNDLVQKFRDKSNSLRYNSGLLVIPTVKLFVFTDECISVCNEVSSKMYLCCCMK